MNQSYNKCEQVTRIWTSTSNCIHCGIVMTGASHLRSKVILKTYTFPQSNDNERITVSVFRLYAIFNEYTLNNEQNYQQYLAAGK